MDGRKTTRTLENAIVADRHNPSDTDPHFPARRKILKFGMALLSTLGGCGALLPKESPKPLPPLSCQPSADGQFDYVVVGSGAGGGPLACNLALAGFKVLLLEAGGDEEPCDYQVPAFHTRVSEHKDLRWDFFVRHYSDIRRQEQDGKFRRERDGVLYPRSGTLGGCTAHNAMIFVYPENSDWDGIARLTGDDSWNSGNMRRYFERLERCEYVDESETKSRHGFKGWLATNVADAALLLQDKSLSLQGIALSALKESGRAIPDFFGRLLRKLGSDFDPNDWRLVDKGDREGLYKTPLSIRDGARTGAREYVRRTLETCPQNLEVRTHALASRILLDENKTAVGVEYLQGRHLYRADPGHAEDGEPQKHSIRVAREVIVCAGAFNTPQLLKLSGIGPADELRRHGIEVKVDLPGVGENLQDRYEVTVVSRLRKKITIIGGMKFRCPEPGEAPDPQYRQWQAEKSGPYATNGATVALIKRSEPSRQNPDLFLFGLIGNFRGYYPGYSNDIPKAENLFTWAVLKAYTNNHAGYVRLRSADPRDVPEINFRYFDEGNGDWQEDLESVVSGVRTVRRIMEHSQREGIVEEEVYPGKEVDTPEKIRQFIKDNAWGHHASCTCPMGPPTDKAAVVDSRFRVHGVRNLRVVDASVFPTIPAYFIVSSVYMISEKASDVIIEDARTRS
ncbi:choline dehydrogenase [Myxococcaceae bacterium]|nr:choline dehydrogenase [Myxococcaceae bacterium]